MSLTSLSALASVSGFVKGNPSLDLYKVLDFSPELVFDFDDEYYRTSRAKTTFESAISHNGTTAQNGTMVDSDGILKWRPHNLLTYSEDINTSWTYETGVTRVGTESIAGPDGKTIDAVEVTVASGAFNTGIKFNTVNTTLFSGASSITAKIWARAKTGSVVVRQSIDGTTYSSDITLTTAWQLLSFTDTDISAGFIRPITGPSTSESGGNIYIWGAHVYRSDLGGMVNNPDRGDSYVPTTTAARYLPRRGHHVYNGSAWVNEGLLIESEQRTNYLPDSQTVETKTVYVTPQEYTLSFNAGTDISSQLSQTIAVTAVDVFVYDTRKDSDGGAWRTGALAQASSWYNETLNTATRGSRREFPEVAVIVAESNKVTIYDGDDPTLPMWMVFNTGGAWTGDINTSPFNLINGSSSTKSCIFCVNGILSVGGSSELTVVSFIEDGGYFTAQYLAAESNANISQRNDGVGFTGSVSIGYIVAATINDVAMTVLPGAPTDPTTGMKVPTIAVATDGGVSVIKDDGTVVDLTRSTDPMGAVSFNEDGVLIFTNGSVPATAARAWYYKPDQLTSDIALNIAVQSFVRPSTSDIADGTTPYVGDWYTGGEVVVSGNEAVGAPNNGGKLYRSYLSDFVDNPNHMANVTTSTYNTGWMNGDIKGAFLSDTDDTDLVAGNVLLNGDFSSGSSGFSVIGTGFSITDKIVATSVPANEYGPYADNAIQVSSDITKQYRLRADVVVTSGAVTLRVGNAEAITCSSTQSVDVIVSPISDGVTIFQVRATSSGFTGSIDNVVVEPVDLDRSVNANGLIINGTATRTAVATGADLVAYSGFSASNYLEQPYNSDLDFGTGDFCVMGWVKVGSIGLFQSIVDIRNDALTDGINVFLNSTGQSYFRLFEGGSNSLVTGSVISTGAWHFLCVTRTNSGATQSIYLDGSLDVSASVTARDVATVDGTTVVGLSKDGAIPFSGSLALWRISATAPSSDQILRIYNDEKVLFEENAQATLYGASDAVTALAHDPDTDLLHVGTSAGRSIFKGLRRIDNTTDAVGTAISASGGFIVEE